MQKYLSLTYTLTIFGFSVKLSKEISAPFGAISKVLGVLVGCNAPIDSLLVHLFQVFAYFFFKLFTKVVCNRLILRIYPTKPIPNSLNVHLNILGCDLHTRNSFCRLSDEKCYNLVPRVFVLLDQRSGSARPRKVLIGSPKRTDFRSNCACLADKHVVNRVAGVIWVISIVKNQSKSIL